MKKFISSVLIASMLLMSGCANDKEINGKTYTSYGFFNQDTHKNKNIEYSVVWGNVFWGVVLAELFLIPTVYFFGYSLFEPEQVKNTNPELNGVVN